MTFRSILATAFCIAYCPALAEGTEGNADAGREAFSKCKSCHAITGEDGVQVVKGGKIGPDLYGLIGRAAGSLEEFNYGMHLVAAGEAGLLWDQETFLAFIADPKVFLQEYLDDSAARSKMTIRLKDEIEALNLFAYLKSVGPVESAAD